MTLRDKALGGCRDSYIYLLQHRPEEHSEDYEKLINDLNRVIADDSGMSLDGVLQYFSKVAKVR